jgi:23S rRNA (uridine2552-2'-O)-methyltransferase
MSRRWIAEGRREYYHRLAKEQGFRSRAAFKLRQLNERFGFFEKAKYVLDLGAAPGGWLQVASEAVGEDGLVVGVDLRRIRPLGLKNVRALVGDVTDEETRNKIARMFPERVDVILSDMAPNVSGVWEVDHLRQIDLARVALNLASTILKPDGWVVLKTFQGPDYERFIEEVRAAFTFVKVFKPRATRKESAEIYVVAHGIRTS